MNEHIKVLYGIIIVFTFALWVSSIGLLISKIDVGVTKYFTCLLGFMFITCLFDFLSNIKKQVENYSKRLPAFAIASCLFYLAYLGFWIGRLIVRFLIK